jgi:hypothetical protein
MEEQVTTQLTRIAIKAALQRRSSIHVFGVAAAALLASPCFAQTRVDGRANRDSSAESAKTDDEPRSDATWSNAVKVVSATDQQMELELRVVPETRAVHETDAASATAPTTTTTTAETIVVRFERGIGEKSWRRIGASDSSTRLPMAAADTIGRAPLHFCDEIRGDGTARAETSDSLSSGRVLVQTTRSNHRRSDRR